MIAPVFSLGFLSLEKQNREVMDIENIFTSCFMQYVDVLHN